MHFSTLIVAAGLALAEAKSFGPYRSPAVSRRANFPIPASKGTVTYKAAQPVSGTFDGGLKTYGRGITCGGQSEGGDSDAVFLLEDGATLKNAIIGADQSEGVHCKGSCTIENVWWAAVCEDALSLKGDGDAKVIGGGATGADDKVIQHNGAGSVSISGFTVTDFGKLYRSCGNCKGNGAKRTVTVDKVTASSGKVLTGINSNYGDTATITNSCVTGVKTICEEFQGTNDNDVEPKALGSGPSKACIYSAAAVAAC